MEDEEQGEKNNNTGSRYTITTSKLVPIGKKAKSELTFLAGLFYLGF